MLARGWLAYPVTPVAHALPPKCGCINTHMYTIINIQNKNRRRAVSYVSTGLARLPRDTGGTRTTAEVRLYKHTTRRMHSRQRRVTPNNPIRTTHTAEGAWGIVPLWEMRFEDALLPIRRQIKTAEERFHMLARGWLAYPVTPVAHALPPKCGYIKKRNGTQHHAGFHPSKNHILLILSISKLCCH